MNNNENNIQNSINPTNTNNNNVVNNQNAQTNTVPNIVPVMPPVMAPQNNNINVQPALIKTNDTVNNTPQIVIAPPNNNPVDATGPSTTLVNKPTQYQQTIKENEPQTKTPTNIIPPTNAPENNQNTKKEKPKKNKSKVNKFLIFLVFLLIAYIGVSTYLHKMTINKMNIECTPVTTTKEEKKLDLNSTIVKDLYEKVKTTAREDLANNEFNDNYKLYLAFLQLTKNKFYETNCEKYVQNNMNLFECKETPTFTPLGFKGSDIRLELKKLFGERSNIELNNIQLGNSCNGGYQYIKESDEYIQGECKTNSGIKYKASKRLISATSKKSIITLKEQVNYQGAEGMTVPETMKSGVYVYTFKLDSNYNYALINKTYEGV